MIRNFLVVFLLSFIVGMFSACTSSVTAEKLDASIDLHNPMDAQSSTKSQSLDASGCEARV